MGDILVDETKYALAENNLEPKCPDCGSRILFVTMARYFRIDLDEECSEETFDSIGNISHIVCNKCGWTLSV